MGCSVRKELAQGWRPEFTSPAPTGVMVQAYNASPRTTETGGTLVLVGKKNLVESVFQVQ